MFKTPTFPLFLLPHCIVIFFGVFPCAPQGLYCAELVARQLALRGHGGAGSSVVLFVLATDTPALLTRIAEELKSSAVGARTHTTPYVLNRRIRVGARRVTNTLALHSSNVLHITAVVCII